MRRLALSAACLVLLAACETGPRTAPPPVGVSQMEIEPGRLRVTYRGTSRMSEAEVRDRALLAAAESAIARGYDWFEITDRFSDVAPPTSPRFTFGLGTGSYGRGGGVGLGASTSTGGGGTFVVGLEVRGGRGDRSPGPDVYNARAVAESLRARLPNR